MLVSNTSLFKANLVMSFATGLSLVVLLVGCLGSKTEMRTKALVNQGMRAVTSGISPVGLNRGIRKAARIVADEIKELAKVS